MTLGSDPTPTTLSDAARPKRPRRTWPWVLLIMGLLVGLPFGGLRGCLAYRAHVELERYRAAGHPTTLAEYEAKYPTPPPPARNGFDDLEKALGEIVVADPDDRKHIAVIGDVLVPMFGQPWPTEVRELAQQHVAVNTRAMDTVRLALRADFFRRQFLPDQVRQPFPSHRLGGHIYTARLFALEHALNRERWSMDRQMQSVSETLQLADTLRGDPSIIGIAVQNGVGQVALMQMQWMFQAGTLTLAQLEELDRVLGTLARSLLWERAAEGEALYMLSCIDRMSPVDGTPPPNRLGRQFGRLVGIVDRNRATYLALELEWIGVMESQDLRQRLALATKLDQQIRSLAPWDMVYGMMESGSMAAISARSSLNIDAIRVAVALERYQLDHSTYPATLVELVPSYLAGIPLDPFATNTSATLLYLRTTDGYKVYSVGSDGKDDGGDVTMAGTRGDDVGFELRRGSIAAAATQAQEGP